MTKCVFPNCSFTGSPEYCFRHKPKNSPKEVKPKKAIAKKSDKQKEIDKELKKLYPVFLALPENERCQLKLKGCLDKANVVHHVRSRIGQQVFEVKDWLASCAPCNNALENDPDAYKKGLKKSKFHE
jgi:hypothetical protein